METQHVLAPMLGTVVRVDVRPGELIQVGQQIVVLESMKMEHIVRAPAAAVVATVLVAAGDTVRRDQPLLTFDPAETTGPAETSDELVDPDVIRPDLAEVLDRHAVGLDANRPEAVRRRRDRGQRTARENLAELCDPDTFVEYGPLVVAAQRQRRGLDDLVARTPADGLVAGVAEVNGSACLVLAYDATVLAGTQGYYNHAKKDRLFTVAARRRLPVVLFAEGGGGRPGDTDIPTVGGLDVPSFHLFARLSGLVPLVGIAAGYCFAGNAALLGCCDVVIATEDSSIGMGGPAMIEGGGLGVFAPEDIGPMSIQVPNGVVDIAENGRMPLVLFAEGGGGRPGDTDGISSGQRTFARFAQLSALVPMVGITSGRCFAGNASLLGCCDVIIATADSSIGMGGPAMIEGGGLGKVEPDDVGPVDVQSANGVLDVVVADEAEATAVTKRLLSSFHGPGEPGAAPDQ
ncbi:MAG TPA: carboxyl transferase domain-containing protein, partial [Actinophytocola sp.]|uniref:carboxyl transferase domain-containing protein n=1 Tax=Actinophytocola sp. TaxID=1872138 RepID=UPI002DB765DC